MTLSEMLDSSIYYETMYILRPDIAEEEVSKHIESYNKILENNGGKVLDSQMRGKRRLAYPIAKHREGIYVQLSHQGDGQHIAKIEKAMRLSEDVIRYLTIKQEGPLPTPKASTKKASSSDNKEQEKKSETEEQSKAEKNAESSDNKESEKKSEKVESKNPIPESTEN